MVSKTEKLLLRVIPTCWSRGILKMRDKLRLYKQVFLPMIIYGHEVWFNEIRNKSTYIERISKLQRRMLRAVTGAYKNASSSKLLELTKELPIEVELQIRSDTESLEKTERANRRRELRKQWRSEQESSYELSEKFDVNHTKRKESIWCLTKTGLFRNFLVKIGLEEDTNYRLCGDSAETAQHLLFECERMAPECQLTETSKNLIEYAPD